MSNILKTAANNIEPSKEVATTVEAKQVDENKAGTTTGDVEMTEEDENVDMSKDESGETTDTCSEKNESKDIDEDDLVYCIDCKTSDCVMWRKVNNNMLICNICHLKRIKNAVTSQQNAPTTKANQLTATTNSKGKDHVRISKRKNKTNKKFTNGFYGDRIIKNGHSKSRRNLYKRKPVKSAEGMSSIVASQSIYHNGLLYQTGDVVCTCDVEGGTYYAQLRGFLQDDYCEKAAVITWLIPTRQNLESFDPMLFVPGLDEDTPRPLSSFDFVCRASTGLFKSRNMHPPFQRSQTNLDNLIFAANVVNTTGDSTEDVGS